MNNFQQPLRATWLIAFIVSLLLPCSPAAARSGLVEALNGNDIAVMPCQLGKPTPDTPSEKKAIIDCTLSELCFLQGNPLSDAADIVTDLLQREMTRRFGAGVLPLDQVQKNFDLHPPESSETMRQAAVQLGKELGVDYVLASTLWRFEERQGGEAGAKKPASVAFAVFLIGVRDGKIYWQDIFDRTQKSLSENLLDVHLYMAKGVRWLSAKDFADYGVQTMFGKLFAD